MKTIRKISISSIAAVSVALTLAPSAKADVPYIWNTDEAQGVEEAYVQVKGGASLVFSCNAGGMGATGNAQDDVSISYSVPPGVSFPSGNTTFQFIIDGQPAQLMGQGDSLAPHALDSMGAYMQYLNVLNGIMASKKEYFKFQIPEANIDVNVSTKGANAALQSIANCDKK